MKQYIMGNSKVVECYLDEFREKQGLYIIKPKDKWLLKNICDKLNYEYKSDIAYIGKAAKTKYSDLRKRAKQEMGWSNFAGATFVRKMGLYLDFDTNDKTNPIAKERAKEFICSNFTVECVVFSLETNLLEKETEYIAFYKPCLNVKKNKKPRT